MLGHVGDGDGLPVTQELHRGVEDRLAGAGLLVRPAVSHETSLLTCEHQDGVLDPARPDILLYVKDGRGLRLAGAEFFAVDPDQNLATDEGRPELFGQPFDGPMPGHGPGMPIHFDLHAWVWKHNPAGTFASWNPRVTCD